MIFLKKSAYLVFFYSLILSCSHTRTNHQYYKNFIFAKPKLTKSWKTSSSSNFLKKIKKFSNIIETSNNKQQVLQAYLNLIKLFLKHKKYKQACLVQQESATFFLHDPRAWKIYKQTAKCLFKTGDDYKALATLEEFIQESKTSNLQKLAAVNFQWSFVKQKPFTFINWKMISLSHLVQLSFQDKIKQSWRQQAMKIIDNLSKQKLMLFATHHSEKFLLFESYLLHQAGQQAWKNKDLDQAKAFFKKALSAPMSRQLKQQIQKKLKLTKQISKTNPYLIGVLVPLSGKQKTLGEKVLKALVFGFGIEAGSPWQIRVKDSKSHPDIVRNQLNDLFYKDHVTGVIGGFTSATAQVIAQKAEEFFMPAIVFSQKQDLALNRDFVFQNAVAINQILQPLINLVQKKLHIKKIAVLYPNDFFGINYNRQLSELVKKTDLEIVESFQYKAKEVDFKNVIKKMFHLEITDREEEFEKLKKEFLDKNPLVTERSHKLTPENLLPIQKNFEAIFIPDSLNQVKKITDHLKYFGVKNIFLLGTNLWDSNQKFFHKITLQMAFVNLYKKNHDVIKEASPYSKFIDMYKQKPRLFEQRAYNAAQFFKKGLQSKIKTRLEFLKNLKDIKAFSGMLYHVKLSKDGLFQYPLSFYIKEPKSKLQSLPIQ